MDERAFGRLMVDVAAALPGIWSADSFDLDGKPSFYAKLSRAGDGMRIGVYYSSYRKRAEASPLLPQDSRGRQQTVRDFLTYGERDSFKCEAGFGVDRPAAAIARDIQRKVVVPFEGLYPRVMERTREDHAGTARMIAACDRLSITWGSGQPIPSHRYGDSGSVHTTGSKLVRSVSVDRLGYARLELSSVPLDKLDAVMAALETA